MLLLVAELYKIQPEIITNSSIKSRICKSMLRSAFAQNMTSLEPIEPGKWSSLHYWSLRYSKDPEVLEVLKTEENTSKILQTPFRFPIKQHKIYVEHINEEVEDNAFLCLGINSNAGSYDWYYISEEYNINIQSDHRVPGRFAFMVFGADKRKKVQFMATQPADILEDSQTKLENLYVDSRRNRKIG